MRRFIFKRISGKSWSDFFWKPWGWGCLGRIVLFVIIMMLLFWLLGLTRSCSYHRNINDKWPENGERNPGVEDITRIGQDNPTDKVPVDSISDWRRDIEDPGPYLPPSDRNYLPPYDDDDVRTGDDGRKIVDNRLNIILDSGADDATFRKWASEFKQAYPDEKYSIVYYDPNIKVLQIQVPEKERDEIMKHLPSKIRDISFKVFPEGLLGPTVSGRPNDPVFKHPELSWYFTPIQAFEAWNITEGDRDVAIAVVDSYFDLYHDDLNSDRIKAPYSVVRRNADVRPEKGCDEVSFLHGSMVASQALGNKNNGRGTAGIAPGCSFIPVSIGHRATSMSMLSGILYSIYRGASVINVSMGAVFDENVSRIPVDEQVRISREMSIAEQEVWDYVTEMADRRNVTIVWASGNDNIFTPLDPSKRSDAAIRVSAVDERLSKADFSNFGNLRKFDITASDISAPGVNIFGAMPFNEYNIGPGTSFAAPIVAGTVALMKSLDPTLTNDEIITILQETGMKPSDGCTTIGPVIRIHDALQKVKSNFLRLDDVLKDHSKLTGMWQSTELLSAIDHNGPTGEMVRKYFQFSNPDNGVSIIYETGSKLDYTGNVSVSWSPDGIGMATSRHTSPSSSKIYVAEQIECTADRSGLLKCVATSAEFGKGSPFYLKRVKSRKQE